jgi:ABC-type polysaccharide/polyol phosphate transport system ATPase subunit
MDIAITVSNISKRYRLYESSTHRLKEALHPFKKKYHKNFWALRDINLTIPQGITFGIIGQNGSGKSTLLQIINGILKPTTGAVQVNGRISALLELGSGFNKEYTGRENVFMQGTIMGISRKEMEKRFDKIEEFADIGHFIEQPAKTYSSGMYVRLAFAVAINIDPEILIVDEALSVGDAMFQRRCYRRLEEFQKSGKTIVFVSHSLPTVSSICKRVLLLDKGKVVQIGDPKEVVNRYSKILAEREAAYAKRLQEKKKENMQKKEHDERLQEPHKTIKSGTRFGTGDAEIKEFTIIDNDGNSTTVLERGEKYNFKVTVLFKKDVTEPAIGVSILSLTGVELCGTSTEVANCPIGSVKAGTTVIVDFEQMVNLTPRSYSVNVSVAEFLPRQRVFLDRYLDMLTFKVIGIVKSYGFFDANVDIRITKL